MLGVVYIPVTDELFYAVEGQGAFKEGRQAPLQAASFTLQDAGLKVVASRSHLSPETQAFMDQLTAPEVVSRGSSLKMIEQSS